MKTRDDHEILGIEQALRKACESEGNHIPINYLTAVAALAVVRDDEVDLRIKLFNEELRSINPDAKPKTAIDAAVNAGNERMINYLLGRQQFRMESLEKYLQVPQQESKDAIEKVKLSILQYLVGKYYVERQGFKKAIQWLEASAANGSEPAIFALAEIQFKNPEFRNINQAVKNYVQCQDPELHANALEKLNEIVTMFSVRDGEEKAEQDLSEALYIAHCVLAKSQMQKVIETNYDKRSIPQIPAIWDNIFIHFNKAIILKQKKFDDIVNPELWVNFLKLVTNIPIPVTREFSQEVQQILDTLFLSAKQQDNFFNKKMTVLIRSFIVFVPESARAILTFYLKNNNSVSDSDREVFRSIEDSLLDIKTAYAKLYGFNPQIAQNSPDAAKELEQLGKLYLKKFLDIGYELLYSSVIAYEASGDIVSAINVLNETIATLIREPKRSSVILNRYVSKLISVLDKENINPIVAQDGIRVLLKRYEDAVKLRVVLGIELTNTGLIKFADKLKQDAVLSKDVAESLGKLHIVVKSDPNQKTSSNSMRIIALLKTLSEKTAGTLSQNYFNNELLRCLQLEVNESPSIENLTDLINFKKANQEAAEEKSNNVSALLQHRADLSFIATKFDDALADYAHNENEHSLTRRIEIYFKKKDYPSMLETAKKLLAVVPKPSIDKQVVLAARATTKACYFLVIKLLVDVVKIVPEHQAQTTVIANQFIDQYHIKHINSNEECIELISIIDNIPSLELQKNNLLLGMSLNRLSKLNCNAENFALWMKLSVDPRFQLQEHQAYMKKMIQSWLDKFILHPNQDVGENNSVAVVNSIVASSLKDKNELAAYASQYILTQLESAPHLINTMIMLHLCVSRINTNRDEPLEIKVKLLNIAIQYVELSFKCKFFAGQAASKIALVDWFMKLATEVPAETRLKVENWLFKNAGLFDVAEQATISELLVKHRNILALNERAKRDEVHFTGMLGGVNAKVVNNVVTLDVEALHLTSKPNAANTLLLEEKEVNQIHDNTLNRLRKVMNTPKLKGSVTNNALLVEIDKLINPPKVARRPSDAKLFTGSAAAAIDAGSSASVEVSSSASSASISLAATEEASSTSTVSSAAMP